MQDDVEMERPIRSIEEANELATKNMGLVKYFTNKWARTGISEDER